MVESKNNLIAKNVLESMDVLASTDDIRSYEVTLIADLPKFSFLEDFLIERAREFQFSPKILKQLLVVADEVFTNIVTHGYARKTEARESLLVNETHLQQTSSHAKEKSELVTLHFFFDTTKKILTLKFIDTGKIYNPLETKDPDIHASLEKRAVGGLGVFLVKKLMDSMEYRHKDGKNILTVQKKV